MKDGNLNDLAAFLVVAKEQNFTRAAKHLGVSQSALSQTIRSLEAQLGIKLLNRTTRRVSPTDAGERLINSVGPNIEAIQHQLMMLGELREKPAGNIRLSATEYTAEYLLLPIVNKLTDKYPEIKVEIVVDYGLTDIVRDKFDAGVRHRESIDKDMIAMRIGPPTRMVVVGAPEYFLKMPLPLHPRDLTMHNCVNLRLPGHGGLYTWEFESHGEVVNVKVEGQLTFNNAGLILKATLEGKGLAYLPEGMIEPYRKSNRLTCVLEDYTETLSGYHLYYPSNKHLTPAFKAFINELREA